MLDWIRIPVSGGYADITFIVLGIALIAGALIARHRYERSESERYERTRQGEEIERTS